MLVGGRARGGEQGGAQLRKFLELSQRERERTGAGQDLGCGLIVTRRQDNASLIAWNNRRLTSRRERENDDEVNKR